MFSARLSQLLSISLLFEPPKGDSKGCCCCLSGRLTEHHVLALQANGAAHFPPSKLDSPQPHLTHSDTSGIMSLTAAEVFASIRKGPLRMFDEAAGSTGELHPEESPFPHGRQRESSLG